MIRYKDKTFEDYSICPATSDIFNAKTGEVQKTYLCQGRSIFKGMPVHRIMAHTYLGYKPKMDIHHLDENPLNNILSNLVYLTHGEHRRLHMKGKPLFNETRAKMSASRKGKPHPHKGSQRSEETKAKMSAAMKGKNKGRQLSEEHRAKISATMKNRRKN